MDADDEAVLSLIAECEWDLSNPPGGMSSSQKESEASLQTSQGRLLLAERVGTSPARGADVCCLRIHAIFLREFTFKCRLFRKSCAPGNISNLIVELQEKSVCLGGCSHNASLSPQVPLRSVAGVAKMWGVLCWRG